MTNPRHMKPPKRRADRGRRKRACRVGDGAGAVPAGRTDGSDDGASSCAARAKKPPGGGEGFMNENFQGVTV